MNGLITTKRIIGPKTIKIISSILKTFHWLGDKGKYEKFICKKKTTKKWIRR
jgi:hypothetical protein